MRYEVRIPHNDTLYCYRLLPADYQRIDLSDVVILDIWKIHDHRYDMCAFFYRQKIICSTRSFSTKKELYGAIQKLLQEYL